MIENFAVVHDNGSCLFLKNYDGDVLDANSVIGLSSYLSMLASSDVKSHQHDIELQEESKTKSKQQHGLRSDICCSSVHSRKFASLQIGQYALIAQGHSSDSDTYLQMVIKGVETIFTRYLGKFAEDPEETTLVEEVADVIHSFITNSNASFSYLLQGCRPVFIDRDTRLQLDRFLADAESSDDVVGGALFLEGALVHSRLSKEHNVFLSQHLMARPLQQSKMAVLPVFFGASWYYVFISAVYNMSLILVTRVDAKVPDIVSTIEELQDVLCEESIILPSSKPPILLRHYTSHDVVAFVYHDLASSTIVCPQPRAGPVNVQKTAARSFVFFFGQSVHALEQPSVTQVMLHGSSYLFHSRKTPSYHMFALYSDQVSTARLEIITDEIVANVKRQVDKMT